MTKSTLSKSVIFVFFLCFSFTVSADSFKMLTWNIRDLGKTKDDNEIRTIAYVLNDYDLIAIQEVVAKDPGGAQAVAQIVDDLNRMGSKWDYQISDPTRSPSSYISERYAFIWRTSKIEAIGRAFLDSELQSICDREPFIGQFKVKNSAKPFFVINFHSRPHNKNPEGEIKYFDQYPQRVGSETVFIAGDFNLDENHPVWSSLYENGFTSCLTNSPTTLKQKCVNGNFLNHAIDNIYFNQSLITLLDAGRVNFVGECEQVEEARNISDHLPVFLHCEIK
ncbi:MAG: endonuclease/exonuclease/phosphatase family protein [Chitinophagales bacterium]